MATKRVSVVVTRRLPPAVEASARGVAIPRGAVIDGNALTRGQCGGEIAGAGRAVFGRGHVINPRPRDPASVVLLPHMGSATLEGRVEMGETVIPNVKTLADGHRPPDRVLPEMA